MIKLISTFLLLFLFTSLNAQWTSEFLSEAKRDLASFSFENEVYFIGGIKSDGTPTGDLDIYNITTNTWSKEQVIPIASNRPWRIVEAQNYFVGYDGSTNPYSKLVIFEKSTKTWSTTNHPSHRFDMSVVAHGNNLYFAGGRSNNVAQSTMDIFDLNSGTWTTDALSEARYGCSTILFEEKLFFIGGAINIPLNMFSKVVDVYDVVSATWSNFDLLESRAYTNLTATENEILIAGGMTFNNLSTGYSNKIVRLIPNTFELIPTDFSNIFSRVSRVQLDSEVVFLGNNNNLAIVYDKIQNTFSTKELGASNLNFSPKGARVGDIAIFTGGFTNQNLEVFLYESGEIIAGEVEQFRNEFSISTLKNKLFIAGGRSGEYTDRVNVYSISVDEDGDGFFSEEDCDDSNAAINPDATEIPYNGLDDDCNELTLDDDLDEDGFVLADDCNDDNAAVNPDATEIVYNGLNDDCNELTLDDDLDEDGYVLADDCNDDNAAINPDATEIVYNGLNDDCNELTLDDDLDEDGYVLADDCNDDDAAINPDATEIVYNGLDDDCNELTLDDDLDQDGFNFLVDCNDDDASINPEATEIPNNGIDEDCDGEDLISSTTTIEGVQLSIFPNPIKDLLFIDYDGQELLTFNIYNAQGQLVQAGNVNNISIDMSRNASGLYSVQIIRDGEVLFSEIIMKSR